MVDEVVVVGGTVVLVVDEVVVGLAVVVVVDWSLVPAPSPGAFSSKGTAAFLPPMT